MVKTLCEIASSCDLSLTISRWGLWLEHVDNVLAYQDVILLLTGFQRDSRT